MVLFQHPSEKKSEDSTELLESRVRNISALAFSSNAFVPTSETNKSAKMTRFVVETTLPSLYLILRPLPGAMSLSADHNDANALHRDNQRDWRLLDNCSEGRQFCFK